MPGTAAGWGGGGEGRGRGGENWQRLMGKIGSASTQALTSSEETSPARICNEHTDSEAFKTGNFGAVSQLL